MIEFLDRLPSPGEFIALRAAVGWPSADASARALEGSLAAVCAIDDGDLVGMGRLVGDGAMYCFAVDVIVAPSHQGHGIGRQIMDHLEARARAKSLGLRLDLVAAEDVRRFYEHLGYVVLDSHLMRKPLCDQP